MLAELALLSWRHVDELQRKSFAKLLETFSLIRNLKKAHLDDDGFTRLIAELDVREQLESHRKTYLQLVDTAIATVFLEKELAAYKARLTTFETQFEAFAALHVRHPEVRELQRSLNQLKRLL